MYTASGPSAIVRQMAKVGSGINIIIEGVARVRADVDHARRHIDARADHADARRPVERTIEVEAHVRRIQELIEKALSLATGLSEELRGVVMNIDDPLRLAYVLATLIDIKPEDKQALLEENDLLKKLQSIDRRSDARDLAARAERQDRVAGAAGDDRRAAPVLPAPADEGHPAGARRRRRATSSPSCASASTTRSCRSRCTTSRCARWIASGG